MKFVEKRPVYYILWSASERALHLHYFFSLKIGLSSLPGFEPGIFWSVVRRVIHCATSPGTWGKIEEKNAFLFHFHFSTLKLWRMIKSEPGFEPGTFCLCHVDGRFNMDRWHIDVASAFCQDEMNVWVFIPPASRVAQWKRAGPITQRSVDRNHALLNDFFHGLAMS